LDSTIWHEVCFAREFAPSETFYKVERRGSHIESFSIGEYEGRASFISGTVGPSPFGYCSVTITLRKG
jgi:hypothetical protein